jgi:AraC-like DNA-binding protein
MNSILFYNSFAFRVYSFKREVHNDNSQGLPHRFFGRLREGSGRLVSKDKTITLAAGDIFYIPHDLPYHSYWTPDSESGVVEWESYRFEFIPAERNRCFFLQKIDAGCDAAAYLDMINKDSATTIADIGNFYNFLGAVMVGMEEAKVDPKKLLFERAEDYIFRHPDFHVPELAKALGMSESGLYAFFKTYGGTTPIKVKNRIQAERAVSLLAFTDMSIEEISDRLGFQSTAYFRKIMKEYKGKAPAEIRKAKQGGGLI